MARKFDPKIRPRRLKVLISSELLSSITKRQRGRKSGNFKKSDPLNLTKA